MIAILYSGQSQLHHHQNKRSIRFGGNKQTTTQICKITGQYTKFTNMQPMANVSVSVVFI